MKKVKILLIATYRGGGVESFCQILINHLSSDFHKEVLLVGNRLYQGLWNSFFIKIFDLVHAAFRLITQLRKGCYDIVQVNPSFKAYPLLRDSVYLLMVLIFGYGNRTVVFFHGWDGHLAERITNTGFYRWVFRKVYSEVGVVFVLYYRCKEQLVKMGIEPQKIFVTTTTYKRIEKIEKKDHKVDEKVNLLFLSLFIKGKGVFIAIKVAKFLIENGYHDFRFIFAGDGPLLPGLREYIKENDSLKEYVSILGYVRGKKKEEILSKSDIFLFPTQLAEGCPVVIIEAMGAGLAVVSTPKGAIPSLIQEGENGFICNSQDPSVFYEAVRKLLDNRELLSKMKKANRKKAEKNYEVNGYIQRMEKIYYQIARNSSSRPDEFNET